jgi:general stress protein YciG
VNKDEVSKVMREMGRKGGLKGGRKGGKSRMAALKPEERKELARKAATKRWQKPPRPTE